MIKKNARLSPLGVRGASQSRRRHSERSGKNWPAAGDTRRFLTSIQMYPLPSAIIGNINLGCKWLTFVNFVYKKYEEKLKKINFSKGKIDIFIYKKEFFLCKFLFEYFIWLSYSQMKLCQMYPLPSANIRNYPQSIN